MATAKQIIDKAKSYLGTKEEPADSNNVVFNTDYYGHEVSGSQWAWCVTFVWDIFRMCGASDLFYDGNKTAGCCQVLEWGRRNGLEVSRTEGRAGDLILFDWDNTGTWDADHIGFIESKSGDGYITIEGNTAVGNDSNGGEVMERYRSSCVRAILRPKYSSSEPTYSSDNYIDYNIFPTIDKDSTSIRWIRLVQAGVGLTKTAVDGIWGDNTNHWVRDFQRKHDLEVDGIAGKNTWKQIFYDAETYANIPAVYRGKKGRSVVICQTALGMDSKYLDGSCGDITVGEIKKFQKNHAIAADGGCGMLTWEALIKNF